MAKEPIDATQLILRQIQETLAEHGRVLADHGRLLKGVSRRLDEVRNGVITALGLATNADVRHNQVQEELDDLKRRVEALEGKL